MMHFIGGKKNIIQSDVKQRVQSSLTAGGYKAIDVSVDGRDVALSGVVASEQDVEKVVSLAQNVAGEKGYTAPRVVDWRGEVQAPKPIVLKDGVINAVIKDGVVTLTGQLGSQQQVDAVLASAYAKFGADNVVNRLTVGENIKPINGLNGLLSDLNLSNGSLSLNGNQVSLRGQVEDAATKSSIGSSVVNALGSNYQVRNLLQVVAPKPVVVEENLVCQRELVSVMSSSKIFFETSSAVIKTGSYSLLDRVTSILGQCPEAIVAVEGHTDSSGGDEMNQDLSKRRAQAVVNYLVGKGIDAAKLTSVGYGESKPIASNETSDGRAQNRRIEFTVK